MITLASPINHSQDSSTALYSFFSQPKEKNFIFLTNCFETFEKFNKSVSTHTYLLPVKRVLGAFLL